jgi:large subunit ribosomal protein L23
MSVNSSILQYLVKPVFSEKAFTLAQMQQYVFEVSPVANKIQLKQAFEMAFPGRKVTAVKVIKVAGRTKRFGKRTVTVPPGRKAVFTVQGEPLAIFNAEVSQYAG